MKIIARVCTAAVPDFEYKKAQGYSATAWDSDFIITKILGRWQAYDIKSGMVINAAGFSTRKAAIEDLLEAEKSINYDTYKNAQTYWLQRQEEINEHEESISFQLNKARLDSDMAFCSTN